MNRKCAAGTGAFLEEIASRLNLPVSDLDGLARQSTGEVTLGSFCTVFTQTEILAKIRGGAKVQDIVKGAFRSVIKRIVEMDPLEGEVVLTGGVVAHNPVIVDMFSEQLGRAVLVPPEPQLTGALGAALYAGRET
jgi:predicted CoA-substrate-specific enzyme activase